MTMWICFFIAMAISYMIRLCTRGFDAESTRSFLLTFAALGAHMFFITRKRAIWGVVVPLLVLASFYPVYKLVRPSGAVLISLIGIYVITLGILLFCWYRARKAKG